MSKPVASTQTLHILNKAPDHPRFSACLAARRSGDTLLLVENAVLALAMPELRLPPGTHALSPDMQARAIDLPDSATKAIGYDDMVALTADSEKVISW